MAHFLPFKGYYPSPEKAGDIAIDSFDNYSEVAVREIIKNNNLSFLNIIQKEASTHLADFYVMVRQRLQHFIKAEILLQSENNSYYIYKKTTAERSFIGLIGISDVRDLKSGIIKLHEQTFIKRVQVLSQYLKEVQLNSEPVALVYEKQSALSSFLHKYTQNRPSLLQFSDENKHELWGIDNLLDTEFIAKEINKVNYLLVADGHHRIMSSLQNFRENPEAPYFLSILFDDENISIEPYQKDGKKFTFQEIKAVTMQDKLLAPKSTWILPKLKTGLVVFDLKSNGFSK